MIDFVWNVRAMMRERNVITAADLHRKVTDYGVRRKRENVYRFVENKPRRIELDLFVAVCDVLMCSPSDLIRLAPKMPVASTGDKPRPPTFRLVRGGKRPDHSETPQ